MFYGPAGTGKTSTICALAKSFPESNVKELNASDERDIDVVRTQIKSFISNRALFQRGIKIIILDEADAMTSTAQFALRRMMEKFSRNARFCFICNNIGKIIPALQSRCTRFRFAPLDDDSVLMRLKDISGAESVKFTEAGLRAIIKLSRGDMRKCLNILQATHAGAGEVNEETVFRCTGNPSPRDISGIITCLLNDPFDKTVDHISSLQIEQGASLVDIIRFLHERILEGTEIKFSSDEKFFAVLESLAEIEFQLSTGCNEKVQVPALVAVFRAVRDDLRAVPGGDQR